MQPSRRLVFFLAVSAAAYAFFIVWFHAPYAGGSDSSGYMNSARLLLEGRLTTPLRVPDGLPDSVLSRGHLFPLGFRLDPAEQYLLPTYPVGLPLHFAAVGLVTGLGPATTVVAVAAALAFAALLYFTCREFGVRHHASLATALLAGVSPLTLHYALQPMSDLVAAVWALAAIYAALRAHRQPAWAVGAGAAFALAVLVRPTNALMLIPALIALPPRLRSWIAFGLGGLPGAAFLAAYNQILYGSALASGYGDISDSLAWRHLPGTIRHFAYWIPVLSTPLVLAAFALPWVKTSSRHKAALLVWVGSFLVFYACYEFTHETWWYLRFILPALPALGIAAALTWQQVRWPTWQLTSRLLPTGATSATAARGPVWHLPLGFLVFIVAFGWMVAWNRNLHATQIELNERAYDLTGRWITAHLPPEAVLLAYQVSGAVMYYTDRPFINPSNLTPDDVVRFNTWLHDRQRRLYAALYPQEEANVFSRLPGNWEVVTRLRQVTIWRRLDPVVPSGAPSPTPSSR